MVVDWDDDWEEGDGLEVSEVVWKEAILVFVLVVQVGIAVNVDVADAALINCVEREVVATREESIIVVDALVAIILLSFNYYIFI